MMDTLVQIFLYMFFLMGLNIDLNQFDGIEYWTEQHI